MSVKWKVGVFHPGTQHSWQTALAFQESGQLGWYATSVFYDSRRWPYRIERWLPSSLSSRLHREFTRRYHPNLSLEHVRQFGLWEWFETGARRLKRDNLQNWLNQKGNTSFCHSIIQLIKQEPVDAVWGANSSSLEVFRWAKKRGIKCILDQTIGHPSSMDSTMSLEYDKHPEFFLKSYRPIDISLIDRQNEEAELADLILVGSDFCSETMIENGVSPKKISVIPYGYDESIFSPVKPERPAMRGRPLDFLFAGTIEPRKGVAYLLQAFQNIPNEKATLTLVGRIAIPDSTFSRYQSRVMHTSQIPRSEIIDYFRKADCFILPSLFEGSAIVLNEAYGGGLGILQTKASGDGVRDGRNGVVIDHLTVDILIKTINDVIDHPEMLLSWQNSSWETRSDRDWGTYRKKIAKMIV